MADGNLGQVFTWHGATKQLTIGTFGGHANNEKAQVYSLIVLTHYQVDVNLNFCFKK